MILMLSDTATLSQVKAMLEESSSMIKLAVDIRYLYAWQGLLLTWREWRGWLVLQAEWIVF